MSRCKRTCPSPASPLAARHAAARGTTTLTPAGAASDRLYFTRGVPCHLHICASPSASLSLFSSLSLSSLSLVSLLHTHITHTHTHIASRHACHAPWTSTRFVHVLLSRAACHPFAPTQATSSTHRASDRAQLFPCSRAKTSAGIKAAPRPPHQAESQRAPPPHCPSAPATSAVAACCGACHADFVRAN